MSEEIQRSLEMDGVWLNGLEAPQWADFISSPQIPSDDFFDREHAELEPVPLQKEKTPPPEPVTEIKMDTLVQSKSDSTFGNDFEPAKMTPVKVISPASRRKNPTVKQTTYDNVLSEAMTNLQLSVKRKSRTSRSTAKTPNPNLANTVERIRVSRSMNFHLTPSNPIPMLIRKSLRHENLVDSTPARLISPVMKETLKSTKTDKNSMTEAENIRAAALNVETLIPNSKIPGILGGTPLGTRKSQKDAQKPQNSSEKEIILNISAAGPSDAELFHDEEFEDISKPSSKITMSFGKRSTNISGNIDNKNSRQPRYSTSTFRRRSLAKYRRRSNKYISLAEAISKFQNGTPKRFRTISNKDNRPGPLTKLRQSCMKATKPISPALRCKTRSRPITALSQEEREKMELDEIRKNPIKANPVRASTLRGPMLLKSIPRKPLTIPEPFKLTETKKSYQGSTQSLYEVKDNLEHRSKVTVPMVVSTDHNGLTIKDAEILHWGIPDVSVNKLTTTRVMPFSFESRNKELQKRKEQKLKELIIKEERRMKVPFQARPVPAFKNPMPTVAKEQPPIQKPVKTKPCPFSFEERDKKIVKKKEELIKQVMEEDRKAREFHAKPVPEFKPVMVRGTSRENVNAYDKPAIGQKGRVSTLSVAKTSSKTNLIMKKNLLDQENRKPDAKNIEATDKPQSKSNTCMTKKELKQNATKALAEFNLNSDKRGKARREFDERIKQKELEIEMARKNAEEEKLAREEAERIEIRRMAKIKARPMPVYKPLTILASEKPLTEPQSPAWAARPKH